MKRKSLLFMLLFALLAPWAANAQTVTIGTGTGTAYAAPIDNYYNYSFTEMLYSASEIGNPSVNTITSVGFESTNGANNYEYGITIYMKNIADNELGSSFVAVSNSDIVYSGTVTPTAGWVTIDLDNAFTYDNTQNLLIAVNKTSGSYAGSSYTWNYTTTTNKTLLGAHNDGSAYNPTSTLPTPGSYGFTGTNRPNVQLTFSAPATCAKPQALAATANGQSATLTWTSDATQFAVAHATDATANPSDNVVTTVSTTSYTMNDLALDQDHYFWVRANCSATDQSGWTGPVSVHIGYCVPAPTSVDNNGISNVTFGTGSNIVNNDTPKATYTDYTNLSGDVQAGVESTIAITFATGYTYNTYVWVDLDNSLSFDADEVICYGESAYTNPTTLTLTFTIDPNQPVGSYRMRIGSADSGLGSDPTAADPCYSSSYGCFQDYTLNVLAAPNCLTPTGLALTTDGETVTATWNGTASTYNIDINGTVTNNVTSPYTFNCALSTTYTVMVQADCGGGETSDWSTPATITTPLCTAENKCAISYSFTDLYNDSWNGASIDVVDVATGAMIINLTMPSVEEGPYTGSFNVCDGREIQFVWNSGSYDGECGYTFTDLNGEEIFSGTFGFTTENYTVNCAVVTCLRPVELVTSNVTATSAELAWTPSGEETAWQICVNDDETNLIDVTRPAYAFENLTPLTTYWVKVRANCGQGDYSAWAETHINTKVGCEAPTAMTATDITISTANIGWTSEGSDFELWYREKTSRVNNTFEDASLGAWTTIDADGDGNNWSTYSTGHNGSGYKATSASYASGILFPDNYLVSPQITLGGSITFWANGQDVEWPEEHFGVAVSTTGNTDAADFITIAEWTMNADGTGTQSREEGEWGSFTVDLSAYSGQGYVAIRHFNCSNMFRLNVDDILIFQPNDEWTTVSNATNPTALSDLTSGTEYEVIVRTNCSSESQSAWNYTTFTTISSCDAPTDLEATALVEEATLEWTGLQENYIVRYREHSLVVSDTLYFEGFEAGLPSTWTTVDADGDGYNWEGHINTGSGNYTAHSGDGVAYSESYSNDEGSALNPDNWLISPQLDLGGVLSVWLTAQDANYPDEHFAIYLSTTGTEVSNFTTVLVPETVATGEYKEYTANLNAYAGQQGYIAIRHFNCSDMFILNVDDFAIVEAEENDWTELRVNNETTTTITGLTASTEYEWQVQGINRSCEDGVTEWSEIATFTTHDYCDDPEDLVAEDVTTNSATLSWTGYQDSYNVSYRPGEDFLGISEYWNFQYGHEGWTSDNLETCAGSSCYASGYDLFNGYFTFVYTTNYPQYLISPEVNIEYPNSTLRLYYLAYAGDSYPETFEVGFSTTTNDVESFQWGETVTATNTVNDEFLPYDIAIPDNAKYFAVKCTSDDKFFLILNNFIIYQTYVAPGEWVDVEDITETTLQIGDLEPDTYYEWYVQGVCDGEGSTTEWVGDGFYTEGSMVQETELKEGWNWFSTYIEGEPTDLLLQLENSLRDNGLMISSIDLTTEYDGEWFGELDEVGLTNEQMYKIQLTGDCTVQLQGMPVDPADIEINIVPGWNWIGYPCAEEVEIEVALSNFRAADGDMLSSFEGYTEYDGEWFGEITTMIPGQGYLYFNSSNETKPLIFNTGAKRAMNPARIHVQLRKQNLKNINATAYKGKSADSNKVVKQIKK